MLAEAKAGKRQVLVKDNHNLAVLHLECLQIRLAYEA